jgi:hypothetical protein
LRLSEQLIEALMAVGFVVLLLEGTCESEEEMRLKLSKKKVFFSFLGYLQTVDINL